MFFPLSFTVFFILKFHENLKQKCKIIKLKYFFVFKQIPLSNLQAAHEVITLIPISQQALFLSLAPVFCSLNPFVVHLFVCLFLHCHSHHASFWKAARAVFPQPFTACPTVRTLSS